MTSTGKTIASLTIISAALAAGHAGRVAEISAVPGPDDQGGMLMPMVSITGFDNLNHRCPNDSSRDPFLYRYGLNVHMELDPIGDDYVGSPATWRRRRLIPRPKRTILVAEAKPNPFADHFMCHLWAKLKAAENPVAFDRHGADSHDLFVDGHVEPLRLEETFDPAARRNLWNPLLAE